MEYEMSMDAAELDKLTEQLEELYDKYPDAAGDALKASALELRREVVSEAKRVLDTNDTNNRSLGRIGSYSVSQVKGTYREQHVDIAAKSPHFHLVEHGHELISYGQHRGFVQGKHFMENARKGYEVEMARNVEKMVERIIEGAGL